MTMGDPLLGELGAKGLPATGKPGAYGHPWPRRSPCHKRILIGVG